MTSATTIRPLAEAASGLDGCLPEERAAWRIVVVPASHAHFEVDSLRFGARDHASCRAEACESDAGVRAIEIHDVCALAQGADRVCERSDEAAPNGLARGRVEPGTIADADVEVAVGARGARDPRAEHIGDPDVLEGLDRRPHGLDQLALVHLLRVARGVRRTALAVRNAARAHCALSAGSTSGTGRKVVSRLRPLSW